MTNNNSSRVQILISDFVHYDKDSFTEYITLQETDRFEIIIPREYSGPTIEDAGWLGLEFQIAAYAGEVLAAAAELFSYSVPDPWGTEPFSFRVDIIDADAFTDALYNITIGAKNDGDELDVHQAFCDKSQEMIEAFAEGIVPVCSGLFGEAYRSYKQHTKEDDDEEE